MLEVGVGTGLALPTYARDRRITGIDLSAEMIDYGTAAARTAACTDRVRFHEGDAGSMPFADDTFDLIVSSMSQHHWSDVGAVIRPSGIVPVVQDGDRGLAGGAACRSETRLVPTEAGGQQSITITWCRKS